METVGYLHWLIAAGVSSRRIINLIRDFELEELWKMPPAELSSLFGDAVQLAGDVLRTRNDGVGRALEHMGSKGIWLLSIWDETYPELLTQIPNPPVLLYGMGSLPSDRLPKIAVIGSRYCSSYGLTTAAKLSKGLAESGVVIVSGMARGIDAAAHIAAIDAAAGPSTIAVLGSGIDICYPPENRQLYRRLIDNGCVVSEYPPGFQPSKHTFPQRNRIISGLSLGIIVVEAAAKSGTSTTVGMALDQGREVFVVPGSVLSNLSVGTNSLIKNGAIPITAHTDVLLALRRELRRYCVAPGLGTWNETADNPHNIIKVKDTSNLSGDASAVYGQVLAEPVDVSYLVAATGISPQDVMYHLTTLEIDGFVAALPGGCYVRKDH